MNKEITFTISITYALLSILYFPLVDSVPKRMACSTALVTFAALYYTEKYAPSDARLLLLLANVFHIYLLTLTGLEDIEPLRYIVSIASAGASIYYIFDKTETTELVQAILICFYPFNPIHNEERMVLVVMLWLIETHYGKEKSTQYLVMILAPLFRLPILLAQIYVAILAVTRGYKVYKTEPEVVVADIEEAEEEEAEEEEEEREPTPPPPPPPTPPKKRTRPKQIDVSVLDNDY